MEEKVWTTKDNRIIKINKMELQHIKNSIKMLKEKGFISYRTFDHYFLTKPPNGEMTRLEFDEEYLKILTSPISRELGWLEEELEARKKKTIKSNITRNGITGRNKNGS